MQNSGKLMLVIKNEESFSFRDIKLHLTNIKTGETVKDEAKHYVVVSDYFPKEVFIRKTSTKFGI